MSGIVYLIGTIEDGPVKIGFTAVSVERRLQALQIGYPVRLHVLATIEADIIGEKQLHKHLRKFRMMGEWFGPREAIFLAIDDLRIEINWSPFARPSKESPEDDVGEGEQDIFLKRREAAAYLGSIGYTISAQTLAHKAVRGDGPSFIRIGWSQVKYRRSALDAWAKSQMEEIR